MKNKVQAFTLAEVLITLGIIGTIAALTIPNLVKEYQKEVQVAAIKKFYSDLSNALAKIAADSDCPGDLSCAGIIGYPDTADYKGNSTKTLKKLADYMKIDKICGDTSYGADVNHNAPGCFGYNLASRPYKLLNGTQATTADFYELTTSQRAWASMSNGAFFGVLSSPVTSGLVYVDTNGIKPPNQIGRDVFFFKFTSDPKLTPYNCFTGGAACASNTCDSDNYGTGCSQKIIEDGWQMKY